MKLRPDKTQALITIPIEVEHFLSFVFGKQSTHGLTGHRPRAVWTKCLKKLIEHLEKCVASNVLTDRVHEESIKLTIENVKRSINLPAQETAVISALFRLCFLLLGDQPNNWHTKRLNRPEHYLLNRHRSLQFTQSPKQKADLIFDTYFAHGDEDDKRSLDYMRVYDWRNPTKFLEWFRLRYRNKYLKLL